ncbi:MAG: TIGR04149 family rSAM-modified RiPP [Paraprevotella sp.]|nr:TIGR04149 family rSAM-modified RiPP [Paraprevotella sp.]
MKINKINLEALSCNERLSQQEMKRCVGGYDTTSDSSCFFNCMEYIGKEVYKDISYCCDVYGNAYWQGYGDYKGSGQLSDYLRGPQMFDMDGNINGSFAPFIGEFFGSAASEFVTGSDIRDLFKDGENTGVMGIFKQANGVAHAVILQGYDPKTGKYSYYDPSKSKQKDDQFLYDGDIYGAIDCLVDSASE